MNSSPAAPAKGSCCIYGLGDDPRSFLVNGFFPSARRMPLAVGQNAAAILAQLGPEIRWFVWHVFLTYRSAIPRDRDALCLGLRKRGILTINEGVTDASKRHTQAVLAQLGLPTTLAGRDGDPEELLFLKSNHNFGGRAERQLPAPLRAFFGVVPPHPRAPRFDDYQIARRKQLRPDVFELEDIVLEHFVANRSDVFYRAFIAFDAVVLSRLVCKDAIKKALEATQRDDYLLSFSDAKSGFSSAPDETSRRIMNDIHRFCRAFRLELGAIDVVMDDRGVPHIIDANSTAFGGDNLARPGLQEHLAQGLRDHAAKAALRPA